MATQGTPRQHWFDLLSLVQCVLHGLFEGCVSQEYYISTGTLQTELTPYEPVVTKVNNTVFFFFMSSLFFLLKKINEYISNTMVRVVFLIRSLRRRFLRMNAVGGSSIFHDEILQFLHDVARNNISKRSADSSSSP